MSVRLALVVAVALTATGCEARHAGQADLRPSPFPAVAPGTPAGTPLDALQATLTGWKLLRGMGGRKLPVVSTLLYSDSGGQPLSFAYTCTGGGGAVFRRAFGNETYGPPFAVATCDGSVTTRAADLPAEHYGALYQAEFDVPGQGTYAFAYVVPANPAG